MNWIYACSLNKIKRLQRFLLTTPEAEILLVFSQGQVFAIDNACPHQGYPLTEGFLDPEKLQLTCPYHHWSFCLKSGKGSVGLSQLSTYPVKIENDQVWVSAPVR